MYMISVSHSRYGHMIHRCIVLCGATYIYGSLHMFTAGILRAVTYVRCGHMVA